MRVQVGAVALAGTEAGTGPPIVLLHGLASTHRWWDLVAPMLGGYRVVRFDHRGHGGSDAPAGGYTIAQLARDTVGFLDALGLDRPVLVGHSLGAAVALRVAAAHPARVAALACVEGGVYDPQSLFGTAWERARPVMTRPRRGRVTAQILAAWLAGSGLPPDALPAILANYTADLTAAGSATEPAVGSAAGPGAGLRLRLTAGREEDLAHDLWRQDPVPLLAEVRVPVLVVLARQGDPHQDGPRRSSLRRARALLGDRLWARWIRGGHDLPLHRPIQVARAVAGLATQVRPPRAARTTVVTGPATLSARPG